MLTIHIISEGANFLFTTSSYFHFIVKPPCGVCNETGPSAFIQPVEPMQSQDNSVGQVVFDGIDI